MSVENMRIIEKHPIIDSNNLTTIQEGNPPLAEAGATLQRQAENFSGGANPTPNSLKSSSEDYFVSILREAYAKSLLDGSRMADIQLQCIKLLAYKSERYNDGKSSSIRVEAAESIMQSIFYTIGLYLKSLPDAFCVISELKTSAISEIYEKGRKLINVKLNASKHIYMLVQKNKLNTPNYTYNSTLSYNGIGSFFESYDPDYEAHGTSASIDYQLCNPVFDYTGVEFIQKYLESLYLENEFCRNFDALDIHHLLYGYDKGYVDLLINIFEHVFRAALGCVFSERRIIKLDISEEEILHVNNELSKYDDNTLALKIGNGASKILQELNVTSPSLRGYIEKSLPQITSNIILAVRTNTLGKVFISPVNPDSKPKIKFLTGTKMGDMEYRKFMEELVTCRYSSDKLAFIKEKVKSFADMEDVLLDAHLNEEETDLVFDILGDIEIAALLKRHPVKSDIQAVNLSESDMTLRFYLKGYIDKLESDRQRRIFEIMNQLADD